MTLDLLSKLIFGRDTWDPFPCTSTEFSESATLIGAREKERIFDLVKRVRES